MNYLRRKLVRDVRTLRWQIVTIALVIAAGVALLVAAFGAYRSLLDARGRFYAETQFADVFARLARAPADVADQLTAIDGYPRSRRGSRSTHRSISRGSASASRCA